MFWKLTVVFGIFLIIDILGHICLKIRRKAAEWILLTVVIIGTVGCAVFGVIHHFEKDSDNGADIYMAYRYLMDGNVKQAQIKLEDADLGAGHQAEVLNVFLAVNSKDYIQGYFQSERLLSTGVLSGTDTKYVKKLQAICMRELGIEGETESAEDYQEYLKQLSAADNTGGRNETSDELEQLIEDYIDTMGFTDKEIQTYSKDYELDSKLNGTEISELSLEDIAQIREKYGDTQEVLRLQCKYYVSRKEYENAKEAAKELIGRFRNEENYVIYTDIIAQEAYEREQSSGDKDSNYNLEDKEVRELVEKAEKKTEQAEKLKEESDESDEEIQERIDKLYAQAEELYKEAGYVDVKRAINYILSKIPSQGDDTGLYDLQLAKLYLITGDREQAGKYLYKVIDNSVDISDKSAIKKALEEVVSQYNQITGDEYNAELNRAVDELIQAQSNEIVPSDESTINGSFDSYVTNSLKYDKINIHISRIDTEQYPLIRAYININGDKEGESELASEFKKEDFDLIDTQYEITDFSLVKNEAGSNVSIAVVMDKSGSMQGAAIANAKAAAVEAVNHMDTKSQKLAVISYNDSAYLEQGLTNRTESLKRVINDIDAYGGTNISKGLKAALEEIKDEQGNRAVILMSDGQDGGSKEDMQEAVDEAVKEGISVYTVAFGDCDDVYMESIAEATGGKFIKASDSADLADIYLTLQRYIVNNYCIEYRIEKNPETDPRYLTVNIGEYNTSSTKNYYLNEENKPEEDETGDLIEKIDENTLAVSSVLPGSVSAQDVEAGMEVVITGGGFEEGMNVTVGNIPLTNISVQGKTGLSGRLKGSLEPGKYDIQIKTADGKMTVGNQMFYVFRAGTTTSVRLGCTTITADTIGQTGDNTLVASGNVMINGFVHSAGDMEIKVDNMNSDIDLTADNSVYVGDSGEISGNSKLYVSYAQMESANGEFAQLVMDGKDYVIQKKHYAASIDKKTASFDRTIENYNLAIPFIMDIDVAEVNLFYNRLQVDIKTFNLNEIVDNVNDSLNHKTGANKEAPKIKKRDEANRFDIKKAGDLALSMALTADGIQFGGEVTVNVNDALTFGTFGVNEVSLKLNSLDKNHEYWSIGGKIDFSKLIPGFGESGIEGLKGNISSYYWLPDTLSIQSSLNPGIPVYKIIEINEVGGTIKGISTVILKMYESLVSPETYQILGTNIGSDAYDYQDIILQADVGAEANLFNAVKVDCELFRKFKEWGEIGTIDGSIGINFSKPELKVEAEMQLLGSEKASAEAVIGKSGLDIKAAAELKLSGFGVEVTGGGDVNLGGNLTGAYAKVGVNGSLDCALLNIHAKGDASLKLEFDWDFDKAAVTVNYKDGGVDKEGSLWYEDNGELFFWNKVHTSSN